MWYSYLQYDVLASLLAHERLFPHVTYYSMNHSEIATNIKNLSTFLILQNAISCKTKRPWHLVFT